MENWIWYGLISAVCFGVNTIVYKMASQKSAFSPYYGFFVFSLGILLVSGTFLLFKPSNNFEWKSTSMIFLAGIIWAIGFFAIAFAISKNFEISKLAPIYNTNTIIAVLLGIFLLKEIPNSTQIIKVIGGAVLIVLGAILVSI